MHRKTNAPPLPLLPTMDDVLLDEIIDGNVPTNTNVSQGEYGSGTQGSGQYSDQKVKGVASSKDRKMEIIW